MSERHELWVAATDAARKAWNANDSDTQTKQYNAARTAFREALADATREQLCDMAFILTIGVRPPEETQEAQSTPTNN